MIIFNAHGNEDSIFGFESNILIQCSENEGILAGKIVHALACEAGKNVAPACIKIGTRAFIGYAEKFRVAYDRRAKTQEDMKRDAYAELIMEPAFEVVSALIRSDSGERVLDGDGQVGGGPCCSRPEEGFDLGKDTVLGAYRRSQRKYAENLKMLLAVLTPDNINLADCIRHNLLNQVCLGDGTATF